MKKSPMQRYEDWVGSADGHDAFSVVRDNSQLVDEYEQADSVWGYFLDYVYGLFPKEVHAIEGAEPEIWEAIVGGLV